MHRGITHQIDVIRKISLIFEEYINDLLVVISNNSLPFDYKSDLAQLVTESRPQLAT